MKISRLAVTANSCGATRPRASATPRPAGNPCSAQIGRILRQFTTALCLAATILPAAAASVKIAWNPNSEPNISNYRVSYGTSSRSYTQNIDAGPSTTATVSGLEQGMTYYFAVRAINDKGLQSEPSAEISYTVPPPPLGDDIWVMDRSEWIVTVSSELGNDFLKSNATDGRTDTYWHSQRSAEAAPHWIAVNLGSKQSIKGFRCLPRMPEQNLLNRALLRDWQMYVSDDGVQWGDPVATGQFPWDHALKEFQLPFPVTGSHVRIQMVTAWGEEAPYAFQVAELNVLVTEEVTNTPPQNQPPIALAAAVSTNEDVPVAITLTGSDPDGDEMTYTIVNGPTLGSLSGTAPNLTYTPHADANGSDSFTFRANDGTAYSNTATISISVTPVNDTPIAAAQLVTTAEDTPVGVLLSATDKDGDSLTYRIVSSPTKGTLSGTAPNLIYTPHPNLHGTDSFSFRAHDGTVNSNTATVSITITSVNDAPVAAAQLVTTAADQTVSIALSATDADGDPLTFRLVSSPIKGRLSGTAPSLIYTPNPDASGSDSFSFRANDGKLDSNTATVSITITAPEKEENAAPVFQSASISRDGGKADTAYITASLAGTATDPDGDAVSYAKVEGPEWLLVSTDGGLSGTPPQEAAGLNTFTIRASDPQGASADAMLEIEIQSGDLPLPWTLARIGEIRPDSTASGDGNSITISSSGLLSATQDNQLLTWQTLVGDGEIKARITAIENAANHTLVGVAIRESLAPNSKQAFMGVTGEGGFTMLSRTSTGGQSARTNSGYGTPPGLWVRLVRKGNIVTSFRSTDGSRWMVVSRANLSLGASCYIGLAVYGGTDELSTGVFDNIFITP